ncbi:MAG: tetratricopeptide repeat protein [Bdellovibrionaceae bacterium]|nr:tetratricopeptide repeat protein [Bdellovibrionales bacterium]MCB9084393.1 tetratricopeptide repeat protein [Pseudobdellovibrionaceae bacterium]
MSSLIISPVAMGFSADSIRDNNQGVADLGTENPYSGYRSLVKALEKDPFNPVIHLNLGIAFLANKEPEKALKSFSTASRLAEGNPEIQFYSLFNGGVAASQAGQIETALQYYQAALDLRPDSKETKTNIELLWQGQSGEGEGQGKGNQNNEDQEKNKSEDKKNQNRDGPYDQKRQPQPFKSKELSQEDMRKILEEIKNQEQKIRAEENEQGRKEAPHGKDW